MERRIEMKKAALLLVLIFFSGSFVFSQDWKGQGRLLGHVLDEQGNPLEGVKVKLFYVKNQSGFEVTTDADGKWLASWIRSGQWNIDFEKAGFMPYKISVQFDEFKRNPEVNINLKKAEGLILTDELKASLNEGNKLFEEAKYEEAIAAYNKILEAYPDAYIINKNIGNSYFKMENYEKAEEYYLKVLEKAPENTEVMLITGNCYANRGQNEKALEWYSKLEFDKINDPTVLYNIGTNYRNISKFEEALKYYKKAVEINEDFLDAIYQLGLTCLSMQSYQEAINAFEKYLKRDPDSERAGQVRGFIEFLKKKKG
jgi:tetratricopeptide (TPR) repeat protein